MSLDQLRGLPGVLTAREDRETLEISTLEPEAVVRELLARDNQLSGLEISGAGLEEAFVTLMKDEEKA